MADVRIKDFANEATSVASDDYVALDGETKGSRKFKGSNVALRSDANISCHVITTNPEYVYAVTDSNGVFLFGVKNDGSVEWQKGVPELVKSEIERICNELNAGKVDKIDGKCLIDEIFANAQSNSDISNYLKLTSDNEGHTLEGINEKGQHEFFAKPKFIAGVEWSKKNLSELEKALKDNGYNGGCGDWSDSSNLCIPEPRCAIVNISGVYSLPTTKTANLDAVIEFWDCQGNYFKKDISELNAQGNSSLSFAKKNFSFSFNDFELKIGNWVSQDSFHLKAFYTDFFRGICEVGYSLYKEILDTRPYESNRAWKKALIDNDSVEVYSLGVEPKNTILIDDGALCFPMGFPCVLYLNGEFYGVYAFQLKKDRHNYMMEKKNKKHIHIDGTLDENFFKGTIDWTAFEIRNPKGLKDIDGNDYDGDNPKEIAAGDVKTYITNFSQRLTEVFSQSTDEAKRETFEKYFDVDNLIDYIIFGDVTNNTDGFKKNWQWTTWNGVKWYVSAYDLDSTFGNCASGDIVYRPRTTHVKSDFIYSPQRIIYLLYNTELNARYKDLRNEGVIDSARIMGKIDLWLKSIGAANFDLEWGKWNDSPCNRKITVNDSYWELKTDDSGNPVIVFDKTSAYNSSTSYSAGSECSYHANYESYYYYVFVCKAECVNQTPITKSGMIDNSWRLKKWIEKNIENLDTIYNYGEV